MGTCPSRRRTDGACLLGWTHLAGEEGFIDNTVEPTNDQPAKKGLSRKGCLWVIIGAIAFIGVCGGAVYVWGSPPTEEEPTGPTLTISDVHDSHEQLKGQRVLVTGFAGMSAQQFWVLNGMSRDKRDRLTALDNISAGKNQRLWLSWNNWASNPGFEESGTLVVACTVGPWFWDISGYELHGIEMEKCELSQP